MLCSVLSCSASVSPPISLSSVSTAFPAYAAPVFIAAVLPSRASTNIDVDTLEAQLSILPNQHFVNALINGLRYGFHIGFSSPRFTVCVPNRPSALEHKEVVSAAIAKEVERGLTVGPFSTPPFPVFACSPLGCVPKKPDSLRLILDLSAPAGFSVNDGIPVKNGAVQYVRFDQIIRMITQLGRGASAGGAGPAASVFLKHLGNNIAQKKDAPYSQTIDWLRCRLSFALLRASILCIRSSHSLKQADPGSCQPDLAVAKGHIMDI